MSEKNVLLLSLDGTVINAIVIDENTPNDFVTALVSSDPHISEAIPAPKEPVGLGWVRNTNGKFIAPPVPPVVEEVDVVAEVVADDRLENLSSSQKVLLEEVLSERIGRPTPRPDEV